MRRWNGWGEEGIGFPLPENTHRFLVERIGEGTPLPDANLDEVLKKVPESRLPDHPLVVKAAGDRVRHARGHSLPDWLALRSGNIEFFPDGVAYPTSTEQVRSLFRYARNARAAVIPYGGGTSVVGHITPQSGEVPILTLDMRRMKRFIDLDDESHVATFGAGAAGPEVEAQLRARGYTLGHFPQSFEFSTLGGWVATRSSGQQSLRYGRMEQLFAGGRLEAPTGSLVIPSFPASSAGPDVREIVLGSEGRLGILTEVRVRVSPLPEKEIFRVVFFSEWQRAMEAARKTIQSRISLSMLRLSNQKETETQLALAGRPLVVSWYERFLAWRGVGGRKCMLLFGVDGTRRDCSVVLSEVSSLFREAKGFFIGRYLGRRWAEARFLVPYLRNSLWERGYAVDTLETATDWPYVDHMVDSIESALRAELSRQGERVHTFTHLSHLYSQGASVYCTYVFRTGKSYEETFSRWQSLKAAASKIIVENKGTISHQHGVGIDHAPYLEAEKGKLGIAAIKALCREFDPDGMMNPGKLVP